LATDIYLVDLTYTQQGLQSEIMPSAVGGIGTYCEANIGEPVDIQIFKMPDEFSRALEDKVPKVIGFSFYAWNARLSLEFAKAIKAVAPQTVIIFGGPHYPVEADRQTSFLRNHPEIDFYIVKEGEVPFTKLISELIKANFDLEIEYHIPSVHFFRKDVNTAYLPAPENRIKDLTDIPSPYLNGWMDKYFDQGFMPIVQTNRGCPFTCTFCVEGTKYYNKINRSSFDKTDRELRFIGKKMKPIVDQGGRSDLFIADSNFGMYKSDIETSQTIRDCQDKYKWPQYVNVATGKNQKERVLESASLMQGALRLSGSVQSLSDEVLENIKRANVSVDQIMDLAQRGADIDANTYSEVILGLPGDSVDRYEHTITTLMGANFNIIETYTLMLLPGSDMDTAESRKKFEFTTRFRAIPRCFGYFKLFNREIVVGEVEEVVISNATLTFDDYVKCRKTALVTTLIYNDGLFQPVMEILRKMDIAPFDMVKRILELSSNTGLAEIFDDFERETRDELWDDEGELGNHLKIKENVERFLNGESGNNVLYKYKALAMVKAMDDICSAFLAALKDCLAKASIRLSEVQMNYISQMVDYLGTRSKQIFHDTDRPIHSEYNFDIKRDIENENLDLSLISESDRVARAYSFDHTPEQIDTVNRLLKTYGNSEIGLSRAVTRTNIKRLLRSTSDI
jgi:radical SAM superfamily enzyme YgiQ (UPF0313 family)